MTLLDAGVKCIFCGDCLPETRVVDHLQNYHQIKSFFLTPNFRDAETQIEPADRNFIYGRKSFDADQIESENAKTVDIRETPEPFPSVNQNVTTCKSTQVESSQHKSDIVDEEDKSNPEAS